MKKIPALLLTTLMCFALPQAYAGVVDEGPPAHQQKKAPDTTRNGDYLEPQPGGENMDAATQSNDMQQTGDARNNNKNNRNKHKGKNTNNKPNDGGVDVNQR